jgi:hypothetical protein
MSNLAIKTITSYIIASITASPELSAILAIMSVSSFITAVVQYLSPFTNFKYFYM